MRAHRWTAAGIVAGALILSVAAALLDHYQISGIGNRYGAGVVVLDRWTGTVALCETDRCYAIIPRTATQH